MDNKTFSGRMVKTIRFFMETICLSSREKIILEGYLEGRIDAELAKELKLTKQQVRGKRQNIYAKLGYKMIFTLKMIEEMKWPE